MQDRELRPASPAPADYGKFLSWRLAVETNNMIPWSRIPAWCIPHLEHYYAPGGQYELDMDMAVAQILSYLAAAAPASTDGKDVWVLDIDDTCLSTVPYLRSAKFGVLPYDAKEFKAIVESGECPGIPAVLQLYKKLIEADFKIFLITSRAEEEHGASTIVNLQKEGFTGYERIIMRTAANRGQSSREYKSVMRRQLVAEGFKIRGNVGDQWSDIVGDCAGERVFKLPNPIYIIP